MNKIKLTTIAIILVAIAAAGYILYTPTTGILPPNTEAITAFTLTDAPGQQIASVVLDIQAIKLYSSTHGTQTIPVNIQTDLADLENVEILLAEARVPVDQYTRITLVISNVEATTAQGDNVDPQIPLPNNELTIAENALLEQGNNAVQIDIPLDTAIQNEQFAPQVVTHVKGGIAVETPEGTTVTVQPGEEVVIWGGHRNAHIEISVSEQGQQTVHVEEPDMEIWKTN